MSYKTLEKPFFIKYRETVTPFQSQPPCVPLPPCSLLVCLRCFLSLELIIINHCFVLSAEFQGCSKNICNTRSKHPRFLLSWRMIPKLRSRPKLTCLIKLRLQRYHITTTVKENHKTFFLEIHCQILPHKTTSHAMQRPSSALITSPGTRILPFILHFTIVLFIRFLHISKNIFSAPENNQCRWHRQTGL